MYNALILAAAAAATATITTRDDNMICNTNYSIKQDTMSDTNVSQHFRERRHIWEVSHDYRTTANNHNETRRDAPCMLVIRVLGTGNSKGRGER